MNSRKPSETQFNPWPYSIIGVFAIAIVAAVVWVGFCVRQGTDLTAADYYEQEIEYQNQLNRMRHGQDLGDAASIEFDSRDSRICIQLPREHAAQQPQGLIHLYRPSKADLDCAFPLDLDLNGQQRIDVVGLPPGLWEFRIRWQTADKEFYVNRKLTLTAPPA